METIGIAGGIWGEEREISPVCFSLSGIFSRGVLVYRMVPKSANGCLCYLDLLLA